jgi:hypothetical protein
MFTSLHLRKTYHHSSTLLHLRKTYHHSSTLLHLGSLSKPLFQRAKNQMSQIILPQEKEWQTDWIEDTMHYTQPPRTSEVFAG